MTRRWDTETRRELKRKRYAAGKDRRTPEDEREKCRRYYEANREKVLARQRALREARGVPVRPTSSPLSDAEKHRRRYWGNPEKERARRMRLGGSTVSISSLPQELQPVARLIRETRLAMRGRSS